MEELPLLRAKGNHVRETTGPSVGPGAYDLDKRATINSSCAPFNSTSVRQPLLSADRELPGPGAYNVPAAQSGQAFGVGSQPFVSESARFVAAACSDIPGPGSYDVASYRSTRKNPRSHMFSGPHGNALDSQFTESAGPGSYNPNYAAADRRLPKAAGFAKYSSREPLRPPTGPGPGSYNPSLVLRSLGAAKPSSMFVTKTKRSLCGGNGFSDSPGPGTYQPWMASERGATIPREQFSAFGSSSSRFAHGKEGDLPGPGAYTGEIAPRRFHPSTKGNSAAFVSGYDRFPASMAAQSPGPGTYDPRRSRRHHDFGEPMPFGSTVPRFDPVWSQHPRSEPLIFSGDPDNGRAPSQRRMRPFIYGKIQPSSAPPPLPHRAYDVRYDWPKPTSMANTTFGTSSRLPLHQTSAVPGPGSYCELGDAAPAGRRYGNSNWGRDVRFSEVALSSGTPEAGKYYHASTFLKKTFNSTIGSDTAWIE
ncbi:Sperm-tail PG-rich repeat, putative [Leishmania lindenbergi]|uniref:Sperm-tail PG-rich repeat n=1 Tax=Leishmania lindenbergi TaxID=651832 RepID=A0AAW2ZX55_9TRYP